MTAQTAKGVTEKTVQTYHRHFRSLGYHLDMTMTFDELTKETPEAMLVSLRKSGVSPNTVSSYARVFRTFLKWCRAEGYTDLSLPNIQDKETVKGSYTDEELVALLKKPASCAEKAGRTGKQVFCGTGICLAAVSGTAIAGSRIRCR